MLGRVKDDVQKQVKSDMETISLQIVTQKIREEVKKQVYIKYSLKSIKENNLFE